MLWFVFRVSRFPFPLWDEVDGAERVSQHHGCPTQTLSGTTLLYSLHSICNSLCPHWAVQSPAGSPHVPGGFMGKEQVGPLCWPWHCRILQWGTSSAPSRQGRDQGATASPEGWWRHETEAVIPRQVGIAGLEICQQSPL